MILFIHPRTDMTLKEIIPMSAPALVNRLRKRWEVLGRFHDEWTAEEVRRASLVLMDIHWYLSIVSAEKLSRRLKAINPRIKIVAGGLSASVFAPQILRDSSIDYIIRGDAEIPLELLAEAVMDGKTSASDLERIPNLATREFESKNWYALTEEDMNANDYRDISWFPTLERNGERLHRWSRGRVYSIHPLLSVYRGCPAPCNFCLGSVLRQGRVFRRNWVLRAPELVRDDLIAFSDDPKIQFVSIYHDFFAFPPPSYGEIVLDRPYDLDVRIEIFRPPSERQIELLARSFRSGKACFALGDIHASSPNVADADSLIARVNQLKATGRFETWISYVEAFVRQDKAYAEVYRRVARETQSPMDRVDSWWDLNPKPDEQGFAPEEEYREACRCTNRYYAFNRLFRASVLAHRMFPNLTNYLLRLYSHNNLGSPIKPCVPERELQEK